MNLKSYITTVENWPIQGVSFKDVTSLLNHGEAFHAAIESLAILVKKHQPDVIVSPEARGFIFGGAIANLLKLPLVLVRKVGKLPRQTIEENVVLEYGQTKLYMHEDAIKPGQRVLILDDVLATGGTSIAMANLVKRLGGIVVNFTFLIYLSYLSGKQTLHNQSYPFDYVIEY
jgi:adenine phosphoribosyltransferase